MFPSSASFDNKKIVQTENISYVLASTRSLGLDSMTLRTSLFLTMRTLEKKYWQKNDRTRKLFMMQNDAF